jgi:hypothetical protein
METISKGVFGLYLVLVLVPLAVFPLIIWRQARRRRGPRGLR